MKRDRADICVVGAGASGMTAALRAKHLAPELGVFLLERQARVGRKLLATGNGRCNLLNTHPAPGRYHGGARLAESLLSTHSAPVVLEFFSQLGLQWRLEEDERAYPQSNQAASVLDVLRLSLNEAGVEVLTDFEVARLKPGFFLQSQSGLPLEARRVILCSGGPASPKLGGTDAGHRLLRGLGHPIVACVPALVQLKTAPELARPLKGISVSCRVALLDKGQRVDCAIGEVLFTDYGLSGIAAMALGRSANRVSERSGEIQLTLSRQDEGELREALAERRTRLAPRLLEDFLTGLFAKRLGQALLKAAGIGPLSRAAASLTDHELRALARVMTDWRLPLKGTLGFESAQVASGGADVRYFDPRTLESSLVPGLFAAGEVLDVDGDCGGYNLLWAWASGLAAAEGCVQTLKGI